MFIKNIYLKNFRGFAEREFHFEKQFSVLVGENGKGKTACLEALCVALGGWLYGFDGLETADKRNFRKNDMREVAAKVSAALLPQVPVLVKCKADIRGEIVEWERSVNKINGHTTYGGLRELNQITQGYSARIYSRDDVDLILPVVAYYSAARLWSEPIRRSKQYKRQKIRIKGYAKSLQFEQSINDTLEYLDVLAHRAQKRPEERGEYDTVIQALKTCLCRIQPGITVDYDIASAEVIVVFPDETKISYAQLSDGYRCMLSLIVDIAYRMATLNPQLKEQALIETPGVVLIDELDLHLHPKWQRLVVADLKKIFPKVQFIATTHSPFVIQSLEAGELISLDEEQSVNAPYSGQSIEDIAEEIMGVEIPQYSQKKQEMYRAATAYYEALDRAVSEEDLEKLREELMLLSEKYGDNVAYYAFIEQKYHTKKVAIEAMKR